MGTDGQGPRWHHDADPDALRVIGKPLRKVDARSKVSGLTQFADDLVLPRMLHMKLLRSTKAHAEIVKIDTGKAQALPGVRAVLTGADLPITFGILPVSQDEHALCVGKVRMIGDPVAAVAAVDEATAWEACRRIEVEYRPLRTITSIFDAAAHPEPRLHDYGVGGNVHRAENLEFGDLGDGFARADHVREDLFFFEGNTHLPMEQHAALAHFDRDGKLTVWSSTQTPHYVHRALARVLDPLPACRIRVIACPNGGGFGGKSDPFNHEICAAKLAMVTGRPVKVCLTREEVFYCHRGRHPVLMKSRIGVSKTGC
jgi:CO/xanthine dehydrogenase Mo-binding subunit